MSDYLDTYNSESTLKSNTSISNNVDSKALVPYISTAELMHIVPILGVALDSQLKTEINNNTISGSNFTLVYKYIIPASSFATWYDASTFMHIKSTNKGLVLQSSDNSTSVDLDTMEFYRRSIKDKMTFYIKRLYDYLEDNKSKFPLYRAEDDDCEEFNNNYSNPIFLY